VECCSKKQPDARFTLGIYQVGLNAGISIDPALIGSSLGGLAEPDRRSGLDKRPSEIDSGNFFFILLLHDCKVADFAPFISHPDTMLNLSSTTMVYVLGIYSFFFLFFLALHFPQFQNASKSVCSLFFVIIIISSSSSS
jgi:hypothetical protein